MFSFLFSFLNSFLITINVYQSTDTLNHIRNNADLPSLVLGMFFGLMIVMAIYNLLIYFSLKDKAYLLYVATTVFSILTAISTNSIGEQFLWQSYKELDSWIYLVFAGISMFFSSRFASVFLKLKENHKRLDTLMWGIALLSLLLSILSLFLTVEQVTPFGRWLVLLSFPTYIIVAFYAHNKGLKIAKFYIISWIPYVLGLVVMTMHGAGWLPNNLFVIFSMELGGALEIVLLSFALAYRIKGMRIELAEKELEKEQYKTKLLENQKVILEKQVNERTKELKKANDVKDKFFAIIAHDLRSSVTSFKGIGRIMRSYLQKKKMDKAQSLSEKMDNASEQLSSFLDNLLNWSFTQLNRVPYHPKNINLKAICEKEIGFKQELLNTKEIKTSIYSPKNIVAFADENGIGFTIGNLLNNAIKFTNIGGNIQFLIDNDDNFAILKIIDNGIGMSQNQLKELFTLKRHNTTSGTQGEKGSGLGLILCKEFIDLNKGTLNIESEKDKGTTVIIKIPLKSD